MNFLYRALNLEEITAGNILIPKSQNTFIGEQRFPITFPMVFGPTENHAVREHQWDGDFETRGISTSLNKNIVIEKYGAKHGVIAVISRIKLKEHKVKEIIVSSVLHENEILHPEDEEVILIYEKDGTFPKEIISEIIAIT
ncbi:MAG: hypothetical protein GY820_31260 [Gammaproteobacteria bacterium]|nr:hypothetical protein [Gammaproteobacteria bacterium]